MTRQEMKILEEFLQESVSEESSLDGILSAFEAMCAEEVSYSGGIYGDYEVLLFESGTYDFTGEPLFWFSLSRMVPDGIGEYEQLQVNVLYEPSKENADFSDTVFSDEIEEDFFDYVRDSETFRVMRSAEIQKVEILLENTI